MTTKSNLILMIIADINNKIDCECHNFPLYDFMVINLLVITLEWVPNRKITIVLCINFQYSLSIHQIRHIHLSDTFSVLLDKKQSTIGEYYPKILEFYCPYLLKTDTCPRSHAEREPAI